MLKGNSSDGGRNAAVVLKSKMWGGMGGMFSVCRGKVMPCILLMIVLAGMNLGLSSAFAQDATKVAEAAAKQVKRRADAAEALDTLASMLKTNTDQAKAIKALKRELQHAKEAASKKELEEKIKQANVKLKQLNLQISALTTGVSGDEMKDDQAKAFNLQSELEGLIQPFVKMIKDATENSR
jgi:hypothetical protein